MPQYVINTPDPMPDWFRREAAQAGVEVTPLDMDRLTAIVHNFMDAAADDDDDEPLRPPALNHAAQRDGVSAQSETYDEEMQRVVDENMRRVHRNHEEDLLLAPVINWAELAASQRTGKGITDSRRSRKRQFVANVPVEDDDLLIPPRSY